MANNGFEFKLTPELLLEFSRLNQQQPFLAPIQPLVNTYYNNSSSEADPSTIVLPPPPPSSASSSSSILSVCGGGGMTSCSNGVNNNPAEIPTTSQFMPMAAAAAAFAAQNPHLNAFVANHFMNNEKAMFGLDLIPKHESPIGIFKIAKNEPSSSSNSQPSTPMQTDRRSVPACAICGTDSTGIHFGVDACAACSAFFRRTVVLNKQYLCNKGGKCIIVKDGSAGQKCRSCRFSKCLNSGMDKNSVQHRRDAIGKYSAGVKREISPDLEIEPPPKLFNGNYCEPSTSNNLNFVLNNQQSPPNNHERTNKNMLLNVRSNIGSPQKSILSELIIRQQFISEQRKLFYSERNLGEWLDSDIKPIEEQELFELTNFSNCMFHLWKVEPRLAADFINRNKYLDDIPRDEKVIILKSFVVLRQSVEEPYFTWKHGGLEKRWFVMPNNTYINCNNAEHYFNNGALKGLNLDLNTTRNLFLPSLMLSMDSVGNLMKNIEIREIEIIVLLGLVMLDPAILGLREETRLKMMAIRDQLIQEIFNYYEDEEPGLDPVIRIADLFMILAAIKTHGFKTAENMQILRTFELIPHDDCFNQILQREQGDSVLAEILRLGANLSNGS